MEQYWYQPAAYCSSTDGSSEHADIKTVANNHVLTILQRCQRSQNYNYGSLDFVRDNPGEPVPEETFTHSVVVINHPLSAFSIYYDLWHLLCSIYVSESLFPQSLFMFSLVYLLGSWPGTLHFILHTFLHPIIVFFSQHMPIPSQPVLL